MIYTRIPYNILIIQTNHLCLYLFTLNCVFFDRIVTQIIDNQCLPNRTYRNQTLMKHSDCRMRNHVKIVFMIHTWIAYNILIIQHVQRNRSCLYIFLLNCAFFDRVVWLRTFVCWFLWALWRHYQTTAPRIIHRGTSGDYSVWKSIQSCIMCTLYMCCKNYLISIWNKWMKTHTT